MFCKKCGTQIADGAAFCPSCGESVNAQPTTPSEQPQQPQTAAAQPATPPVQLPSEKQQKIGIIWSYISVVVAAALAIYSIIGGIMILNGHTYTIGGVNFSKIIYKENVILYGLDIFYGIICFGSAIWAAYCIYLVLARKKKAPDKMSAVFVVAMLGIGMYNLFRVMVGPAYATIGTSLILARAAENAYVEIFVVMAVALAFEIAGNIFFKKIKHLFVN
ncbi:MAG: zinc-ribbon domain-containing protein [Clostridia bacterium]|nr:zinc-ribbon domain-containing protein [Clostridia bacterium]